MTDLITDFRTVREAIKFLQEEQQDGSSDLYKAVVLEAIAAWERVDKVLYEHIAKLTLSNSTFIDIGPMPKPKTRR